jgi:hypothetical protein
MKQIQLGDEVIDTITGFKGIAIAKTRWISGCDRINVQPKGLDKDGHLFDTQSFDEPLLKIVKKKTSKKKVNRENGGPRMTIINNKF